jgi:CDP-diacylglycerol--glycerol-3-phosphate 3-phosphatidyltransferase
MQSRLFTIPNLISLIRFPLALPFLYDDSFYRSLALILAMMSDGLDGYFARRYNQTSRAGAWLDPLSDKFFVAFVLVILLNENRLLPWEALTMLCRDFAVFLFSCYLFWQGQLSKYQVRAIWCGKVTTAMQFAVLLGLIYHTVFPPAIFIIFIILGLLSLGELYIQRGKLEVES